jgi:hypothetical protein
VARADEGNDRACGGAARQAKQKQGKWARRVQITNWAFGFEPGHEIPLRALHTCGFHIRSGYRCVSEARISHGIALGTPPV